MALKEALADDAKMIPSVIRAGQAHDTSMVLLAISVVGEGAAIPSETNQWLQRKLALNISTTMKNYGDDLWQADGRNSKQLGRLFLLPTQEAGYLSFVGVIGRTRSKTDEFRTHLINTVDLLNRISDNIKLRVLAWSLPFSFNQLSEMFGPLENLNFDRVAEDLIKRVKRGTGGSPQCYQRRRTLIKTKIRRGSP